MENFDIIPIININEDIAELTAKLETVKADLRIEETMREAFSKDLTPKILRRKERYKRVNGVRVAFAEVTVYETELNDLVEAVKTPARIKQNNEKLQTLGAQLKRETSQTAIYQRCVEAEAEIKRLKTENMLLQAKVTERDREIAEIYAQGTEPYIDYEEQTYDLEI
ncbi:MAG: hypothetical protein IKT78_04345 [Ruminiclostridium sp.]|nr:hypothetical protein [Ruminiclostridium sp.]